MSAMPFGYLQMVLVQGTLKKNSFAFFGCSQPDIPGKLYLPTQIAILYFITIPYIYRLLQ